MPSGAPGISVTIPATVSSPAKAPKNPLASRSRALSDWREPERSESAYELANVTAAAPITDALRSRIAKSAPVPCPTCCENPLATPRAFVNELTPPWCERPAALAAINAEAPITTMKDPSTVSTRS